MKTMIGECKIYLIAHWLLGSLVLGNKRFQDLSAIIIKKKQKFQEKAVEKARK